jgi:polyferredoxin
MPTSPPTPLDQFPRLDRFRPQGTVRGSKRGRWRAAVLIAVHVAIAVHLLQWWLTGRTLTPIEPSEAMETLERGVVNAGALMFVIAIVGTLLFGRFLCGWGCHLVAYQDGAAWLLAKLGMKPRPMRSRLLVAVPFVVAGYMFVWPSLHRWWSGETPPIVARLLGDAEAMTWGLVDEGFWDTFPSPWMGLVTFLVLGWMMIHWLGAKGFCTYGCPYGAFFVAADRLSPLRIVVDDSCRTCGHCTATCTSNVRVHEEVAKYGMVVDSGCMKTMDCVSACPNDALSLRVATPAAFRRSKTGKPRRLPPSDFTWGEEALLAITCALSVVALRGLYVPWFDELVPFLLSVGLGVLTAVGVVMLWRVLRHRDLTFQHAALRRGGRLTGRGRIAVAVAAVWCLFTLHAGVVHGAYGAGERGLQETLRDASKGPDLRRNAFEASLGWFDTASGLGLYTDPRVEQRRGWLLRELGRLEEAERALRAALATSPGFAAAAVPLADLLIIRQDVDGAAHLLRGLAPRVQREDPAVRMRLERLEWLEQQRARSGGQPR